MRHLKRDCDPAADEIRIECDNSVVSETVSHPDRIRKDANVFQASQATCPPPIEALPGRDQPIPVPDKHTVSGTPLLPPFPEGVEYLIVGMGCFWGAERNFWQTPGVYTTAVGYAGGFTPNPTYHEVCSGRTGHTEVVLVAYDPTKVSTRGDAAGASGRATTRPRACARATTSARSTARRIYWTTTSSATPPRPRATRTSQALARGAATARSRPRSPPAGEFYYAEDYHQQYLAKNPAATAGSAAPACRCPIGTGIAAA